LMHFLPSKYEQKNTFTNRPDRTSLIVQNNAFLRCTRNHFSRLPSLVPSQGLVKMSKDSTSIPHQVNMATATTAPACGLQLLDLPTDMHTAIAATSPFHIS
jgi:hypothetical protein